MPVQLELSDGKTVTGAIDTIAPEAVTLERSDESVIGTFAAVDIAAFTLIDAELDRSDELRPLA